MNEPTHGRFRGKAWIWDWPRPRRWRSVLAELLPDRRWYRVLRGGTWSQWKIGLTFYGPTFTQWVRGIERPVGGFSHPLKIEVWPP